MKKWFNKYLPQLIGAGIGATAGFLYWKWVGCASGTCAITSRPLHSSLYGALLGLLAGGLFKKETNNTHTPNQQL